LNSGSSPTITTVTSSGTYTIAPYEQGSGPNALKILKSTDSTTGAKTWYYIEARQGIGFDSFLSTFVSCPTCYTQNETTGVLFHIGTDGDGNTGDLLDMTPATLSYYFWFDPSLAVGQSFQDATAGVSITPTAVGSTGATVQITIDGSPAPGPLTTSVTTNQSTYLPGQTVAMTVTVDSGTSPVAGIGVTATVKNPNGTSTTLKGTTGSAGTASLSYNLSRHAHVGTYQIGATTASSPVADAIFTVQ
jgi:hypothetical protein